MYEFICCYLFENKSSLGTILIEENVISAIH